MAREQIDPGAMLCWRCGYPLDGVAGESACPECGTAIELSRPEFRTGSPWQRAPSIRTWICTLWRVGSSRTLFDRISVERGSARWLTRINIAIGALLIAGGFAVPEFDRIAQGVPVGLAPLLGTFLIVTPIMVVVLSGLTRIESTGLRFFGNRRGGRITPAIARAVTGHASYGWLVAGSLVVLGSALGHHTIRVWFMRESAGTLIGVVEPHVLVGTAGFLLGMFVFETLSYLGALRCRFANPPGREGEAVNKPAPEPEPTLDEHAATTTDTTDLARE